MNDWYNFDYILHDMNPPEDSWLRVSFDMPQQQQELSSLSSPSQQQQQPLSLRLTTQQPSNPTKATNNNQTSTKPATNQSPSTPTTTINNNGRPKISVLPTSNNSAITTSSPSTPLTERSPRVEDQNAISSQYSWLYPGERTLFKVNHVAYVRSKHFIDHEHCHTSPDFTSATTTTSRMSNTFTPQQQQQQQTNGNDNNSPTASSKKSDRKKKMGTTSENKQKRSRIIHGSLYITNYQLRFTQEKFADDDSDDEDNIVGFDYPYVTSMPLSTIATIEEKLVQESSLFKNYSQPNGNNESSQDSYFSSTVGLHHHHNMIPLSSSLHVNGDKSGQSDRNREEDCTGLVYIHGKNIRSIKLAFFGNSTQRTRRSSNQYPQEVNWNAQTTVKELNSLITNYKVPKNLFAFHFGKIRENRSTRRYFTDKQIQDGWNIYDMAQDFAKRGVNIKDHPNWRISEVNNNYQICDTYPRYLVVPKSITDDQIRGCAAFRSKGRIPALSWVHPSPTNGGCILRCSQPMVGVMRSRSKEDEELVEAIRKTTSAQRVHIIDCRPKANALAQTVMGRGYEDMTYYNNCSIEFMGIENIHAMHSSLQTLTKLCNNTGDVYWLSSLESTGWLRHCRLILQCAQKIVEMVEHKQMAVIVHCSDGWDRTSQVSALSQVLLDPYYRTIRGFEALIEKEWCSFGHKFCDRIGHTRNQSLADEVSPVFMQFIDCIWQVLQQFPTHFEFNESFLVTILDHLYSCLFGNFLHNSEKEREADNVKQHTISLWTFINSNRQKYVNRLYDKEQVKKSRKVLIPDCGIETLTVHFWIGYFYRYRLGMKAKYQIMMSRALNTCHIENVQIRQTLAHETKQREQVEKELQAYKNRMGACMKWLETRAPEVFAEEKDATLAKLADGDCNEGDDEDDDQEESVMRRSVRLMENYFQ